MNTATGSRAVTIIAAIVIGAIAMAAGIWAAMKLIEEKQAGYVDLDATRFPVAREIGPFSLVDHRGNTFDNSSLAGRWSFMFFGYTHCPDVCPTTLSILNGVANHLEQTTADVNYLFVSVDPERDTPEQMAGYVRYFNKNFIGVTGTPESVDRLTGMLGIMHAKDQASATAGGYLVDHSASILLFDPDGRFHAVYTPPFSVESITTDFSRIRDAYR